ncbi:MAG: LytS/YhcK type 5TM receptor domain-containing protein [Paenibacillaceae bacterium]
MESLTLLLVERMGMLLILTFILTQFPLFRQLFDQEFSLKRAIYSSILFGLFGILGTYAGIVVQEDFTITSSFWLSPLQNHEAIAHSALVGVVIGGLTGGLSVGLGAGILTGLHLYYIGGYAGFASGLAAPIIGLLTGLVTRLFLRDRVVPLAIAFFCGVFAPVVLMGSILIFVRQQEAAILLVNTIAMPMMMTNSISIAIFMMMLKIAKSEEERTAAYETQRAMHIAELALPHLKQGLTYKTAEATAKMLARELKAAAVALTDTEQILAFVGIGTPSHEPGERIQTELSLQAIASGEVQIAYSSDKIRLNDTAELDAAIIVPFSQAGKVAGLIKLYFKNPQQIRKVEVELAKGLGKLISYQLNVAANEGMAALLKEAELRMLQAQINPHFLFNTLNSINSLIRVDPDLARHITIQLGTYMRLNLKLTSAQLIPIQQEMDHFNTYLEIMKIRFSDQFSVYCEMDPEAGVALIPPATFQPLVENSIEHGLKVRTNGGWVRLQLLREKNKVQICIEDNGPGIPEELLNVLGQKPLISNGGNGIGVFNVNQRLINLFGNESKMRIENKIDGGSIISFTIPFHLETKISKEHEGGENT